MFNVLLDGKLYLAPIGDSPQVSTSTKNQKGGTSAVVVGAKLGVEST
jgi:hypothetical protein